MSEYGPETYGKHIAGEYDEWYGTVPEGLVDRLAQLAGDGRALELGIGTGRIALPLGARGVEVAGIDASPDMVARLHEKDGGAEIPVSIGDFADVDVEGPFSLVFVVFNTFFGLLSQEAQVRCFENVAARLEPGGLFLIEAFVPDVTRFDRGQRVSVSGIEDDHIKLEVSLHDPVEQRTRSRHLLLGADHVRAYPVEVRYAYPPELDLMARLAGLELRDRCVGGTRSPSPRAPRPPSPCGPSPHSRCERYWTTTRILSEEPRDP